MAEQIGDAPRGGTPTDNSNSAILSFKSQRPEGHCRCARHRETWSW